MQLTYNEALRTIIDHTEMGYTIASQDRLWITFIFDLDADGEYADYRYNRVYPMVGKGTYTIQGSAYDHDMDHDGRAVPLWTSRAEAEYFAEVWRKYIDGWYTDNTEHSGEKPEVYVMNLGDDARYEANIIGRYGVNVRETPKFKGSEAAWAALAQMHMRWVQWQAEREAAKRADDEPSCP